MVFSPQTLAVSFHALPASSQSARVSGCAVSAAEEAGANARYTATPNIRIKIPIDCKSRPKSGGAAPHLRASLQCQNAPSMVLSNVYGAVQAHRAGCKTLRHATVKSLDAIDDRALSAAWQNQGP